MKYSRILLIKIIESVNINIDAFQLQVNGEKKNKEKI